MNAAPQFSLTVVPAYDPDYKFTAHIDGKKVAEGGVNAGDIRSAEREARKIVTEQLARQEVTA